MVGTVGQTKPAALLREKRTVVPNRPVDLEIDGADQIILEKQHLSLFTNPNTDALIKALAPAECVVYGVVTEYCVQQCAIGLLDRGYRVSVVKNAIESLDMTAAARFLSEFAARGGTVV